jgi:hypothetical protein
LVPFEVSAGRAFANDVAGAEDNDNAQS